MNALGTLSWEEVTEIFRNRRSMKTQLETVAQQDVEGLLIAQEHYGDSWKKRGGVGAFMMLARKWDRLEQILSSKYGYDVLKAIIQEANADGETVLDSVRDLRRYLALVEAEVLRQGVALPLQRDNKTAQSRRPAVVPLNVGDEGSEVYGMMDGTRDKV